MSLINTLIHGDCFNILSLIPDHSIDLILTDPPYNILENFTWDQTPIDLTMLWNQLKRILTPNGVIAIFCAEPFTSRLILSNLEMFQYKWVWEKVKGTNFMQCHKRPQNNYEEIVVFYSSTNPIYNPQMKNRCLSGQKRVELSKIRAKANKPEFRSSSSDVSAKFSRPMLVGCDKLDTKLKYPTMVIDDILPLNSSDSERTNHPTQKPIRLYEYFIKTYTNEKMTVLDCFSGSNVVAVSCLNLKRNWISIELETKYIIMGLERLRNYFNHGISIKNHTESFGVIYSFIKPLDFIVQREQAKQKVSK